MECPKGPGQRLTCGCIMSKDIGEYNTCPHLCHYCYANTNNAAAGQLEAPLRLPARRDDNGEDLI